MYDGTCRIDHGLLNVLLHASRQASTLSHGRTWYRRAKLGSKLRRHGSVIIATTGVDSCRSQFLPCLSIVWRPNSIFHTLFTSLSIACSTHPRAAPKSWLIIDKGPSQNKTLLGHCLNYDLVNFFSTGGTSSGKKKSKQKTNKQTNQKNNNNKNKTIINHTWLCIDNIP